MNFDWIQNATQKELEQFRTVCNHLLRHTYLVRTLYRPEKGRVHNPDYLFLAAHREAVADYLSLLDWQLFQDDANGYFYIRSASDANRCQLDKRETAILLALRLIYDERMDQLGMEQDVLCTVRDLLEKLVTEYAILPVRPNMDEVRRAMLRLEEHAILQRMDGRFHQPTCQFAILPTILTAVSQERLQAVAATLRKEEADEEAARDSAD